MKEKSDLILKDCVFNEDSNISIADMIEFSYYIAQNKNLGKLNDMISNYALDGIITYATFVRFCYMHYMTEGYNKYWSLWEITDSYFEELVDKFIEKYYYEEEK